VRDTRVRRVSRVSKFIRGSTFGTVVPFTRLLFPLYPHHFFQRLFNSYRKKINETTFGSIPIARALSAGELENSLKRLRGDAAGVGHDEVQTLQTVVRPVGVGGLQGSNETLTSVVELRVVDVTTCVTSLHLDA